MRIRTIKPEFWQNESMAALPLFSRLLAIALLNYSDDEGCFMANPRLIRGQLFPLMEDSSLIVEAIQDLIDLKYIELGTDSSGRSVGRVINFNKHQRIDKPKKSVIAASFTIQDESKINLRHIQDDTNTSPRNVHDASEQEGKGTGNRKQEIERERKKDDSILTHTQDLESLITLINSIKPAWSESPHLSHTERQNLQNNKMAFLTVTNDTWETVGNFAKSPEGQSDYTLKTRSLFILHFSEVIQKSREWQTRTEQNRIKFSLGGRRPAVVLKL